VTKALAYYYTALISVVKGFLVQSVWYKKLLKLLGRIKHYATIAHTTNKLTRLCSKSVLQAKVQPTREKHFPYAPHWGRLLALFTNTRLGWKGLPATNTPTYYEDS
jgi:hypothetical protein